MATAPSAVGPQGVKPRREMQEVTAPEQFQFTDRDPALSGVLLDISKVTVKGKETTQYMLQDEDKQRYTFLATYDLQRKILPEHIGHFVLITYEGEDMSIETQGSPLRKFRVQVSKEKEPGF